MAATKVSDLTALGAAEAATGDLLYIVDVSAGTSGSKKITLANLLTLADNVTLKFGTGSDITILWDATNLVVGQAAADSFIQWGVSGAGINHTFFGDTATRDMTWDQSNDQLLFADNAKLAIGSGGGAAGDITFSWDATNMVVAQLTADSNILWGVSGAGINHTFYGDTATRDLSWDQTNDQLLFADNAKLAIGSGAGAAGDITFTWDATNLVVAQLTADSVIQWGVSGAGINHLFYGDTATRDMTWDQSNDQLLFADNAKLAIGSGGGAAGDITFSWDATKMVVAQLTANSAIEWGVDGAGIDMVLYADTASSKLTWDQSADSLIFTGVARQVWTGTTGQCEMHLTDNLADALSIEISGAADLMVFTTTDSHEAVAVKGLRANQTTAAIITGATELTLADSGGVFMIDQDAAFDIDLPNPTSGAGCTYFFTCHDAGANNVTITVKDAGATFIGHIVNDVTSVVIATGSTITLASGSTAVGDSVMVRSLSTTLYHVAIVTSTAGGITVA